MNEYEEQALTFCHKHNTTIDIKYLTTGKHFADDKDDRDIYTVTIARGNKTFTFNFGDSISNTEKNKVTHRDYKSGKMVFTGQRKLNPVAKPSKYDILACIQKYDIGDFDSFCSEYGYEFNTERQMIKIKKIYFDVLDEYRNVSNLFHDCMDELQEIC